MRRLNLPTARNENPSGNGFFDLILSSQYFQWVNDLPGMLIQCRNKLKPDGLLLANFFGGRTLQELRACLTQAEIELSKGAYTRCIPMVDIKAAGGLLQRAGFALPVCDSDIIEVLYPSIFELMADLRRMGRPMLSFQEVGVYIEKIISKSRPDIPATIFK